MNEPDRCPVCMRILGPTDKVNSAFADMLDELKKLSERTSDRVHEIQKEQPDDR